MPALNFLKQFVETVERGHDRQTIRAKRKHPIKRGDRLYLYTGMRTKDCRGLGEAICSEVEPIIIDGDLVCLSGRCLKEKERDALARADGFSNYAEMEEWFNEKYTMPFSGHLIRWGPILGKR